jgi:pimeloyl-ACP methyl ester carboxylesterase
MWAVMRLAPKVMYSIVAVPASLVPTLPPEERAKLDEMISIILPVSQRRLGVLNEGKTQGAGTQYPLEQIGAPTLLISAEDDLYRTLPVARHAARVIPNAKLVEFLTGGHLLLDRGRELWPAVAAFIRQ